MISKSHTFYSAQRYSEGKQPYFSRVIRGKDQEEYEKNLKEFREKNVCDLLII